MSQIPTGWMIAMIEGFSYSSRDIGMIAMMFWMIWHGMTISFTSWVYHDQKTMLKDPPFLLGKTHKISMTIFDSKL